VRNLLDHRSGFSTLEGQSNYLYASNTTFDEVLNRLAQYHLSYQPGMKYEYSNLNYILLAQVIARASGQPYPEYVQKNILDPLQMSNATFADHHTLPQAATGNQVFFGIQAPFYEPYTPALLGAGNLSASSEDMAHYLIPFFNRGEYRGNSLLAAQSRGWYDTSWNWHSGSPGYGSYSHTGGPDSFHANIQFVTANQETVLVTMLMNTRLDTLLPGPAVYEIADNVAKITLGLPYELLSTRELYTGWALFDGFLLLMIASITWQVFKLKSWKNHYQASETFKKIISWVVIVFDLLICAGIIVLPSLANSKWEILLYHRPDFAAPLFIIALCLGAIGIIKVVLRIRGLLLSRSKERSSQVQELTGASNG
ncbi:MAG: serine hydrolase domain-containing protein, partial [Anaerolineaceae bacterium]